MASQALLVVLGPTLVAIGADLGAPVGAVGQARTIAAAVAIPASLLLSRYMAAASAGVRRTVIAGAALALAACALVAASRGLPLFLAAHAVVGLAFALLLSGGFGGVADLPPARRSAALGYTAGGNALAWIVVNPLAGMLTDAVSWRAAQAVPAALAAAALLAPPRAAASARAAATARLGDLFGLAGVRRWVASEVFAYTAWTGFLSFAGALFIQTLGLSETSVGWLLATGPVAYVAAASMSGRLALAVPRVRLVAGSALAMAVLLVVQFAVSGSVLWAALALCLISVVGGIRTPASAGLGMAVGREHPAAMMAVRTATIQVGHLLGAGIGGVVIESAGYHAFGAVLAVTMVVAAALALSVRQ